MSTTVPPHEPGRHGWAELLRLVDGVRTLAYDQSLAPDDAMRRIRDRFHEYDETRARRERPMTTRRRRFRVVDGLAGRPARFRPLGRRYARSSPANWPSLLEENDQGNLGP
jgi:hypothetical protein